MRVEKGELTRGSTGGGEDAKKRVLQYEIPNLLQAGNYGTQAIPETNEKQAGAKGVLGGGKRGPEKGRSFLEKRIETWSVSRKG